VISNAVVAAMNLSLSQSGWLLAQIVQITRFLTRPNGLMLKGKNETNNTIILNAALG